MSTSSTNYHLLAIPAYYIFSIAPHIYAQSILTASGYKANNANPKASLSPDAVKGKVPDAMSVSRLQTTAQSNSQPASKNINAPKTHNPTTLSKCPCSRWRF
jgi:hypothetical protein